MSGETKQPRRPRAVIGWREYVSLPELGLRQIKAKIDTGARTSALHASNLEFYTQGGKQYVRFSVPDLTGGEALQCALPIVAERAIKNTSGVPQVRTIVSTLLRIGEETWPVEVSLADREQMTFDLILGRTAIRHHRLLVDPGRSFLLSKAGKEANDTQVDTVDP